MQRRSRYENRVLLTFYVHTRRSRERERERGRNTFYKFKNSRASCLERVDGEMVRKGASNSLCPSKRLQISCELQQRLIDVARHEGALYRNSVVVLEKLMYAGLSARGMISETRRNVIAKINSLRIEVDACPRYEHFSPIIRPDVYVTPRL